MASSSDTTTTIRLLASVLRVRKWVILQAVILVPAIAVALSSAQKPQYQASAQVIISRQSFADTLTGTTSPNALETDFNRVVQTQAQIAQSSRLAELVSRAAHATNRTAGQVQGETTVTTDPNTNILTFAVTDANASLAVRLASQYATQFVNFSAGLNSAQLLRIQSELGRKLAGLREGTPLATSIRGQLRRIQNLLAIPNGIANVIKTAQDASQVQPTPFRNGAIGLIVGIIVGFALAFGFELLDTRLRTGQEIEARLELPLLARIPTPPKALREQDRLAMIAEPNGQQAENFRILRTNLSFADVDREAKTILITSAIESEGKSTTIANLAVALAGAGKHVILADLDFRRPYIERFFDLPRRPGITSIVLGEATLDESLVNVALPQSSLGSRASSNGKEIVSSPLDPGGGDGRLEVLPTGELPPNAGELVVSESLGALLEQLSDRCDVLLVDAPPLLHVGDAMALSRRVDAVLVVARLGLVRRPMLDEVRRLLGASRARVLGVIITDAAREPGLHYGDYYYGSGSYGGAPSATVA